MATIASSQATKSARPKAPEASASRSTPVENARPAPVSTTTRTSRAPSMRATVSARSRTHSALPALSTSGRSSVTRASGPSTARRMVLTGAPTLRSAARRGRAAVHVTQHSGEHDNGDQQEQHDGGANDLFGTADVQGGNQGRRRLRGLVEIGRRRRGWQHAGRRRRRRIDGERGDREPQADDDEDEGAES